ncbi:conserved hypothetical protein, possible phosphate transport regulator [Heliomicrobium modesticaldum Ice1]|uniref:Phosphate transport regulator n=1 Tax=Heliobacterium modesticaldum (strain ATCC 51547 / Ice1) TaxID=498761 RepID=B0TC03_HELMI|nr:DUF47 family protein [Heliomicrobium modesticaldum]ABZ85276.1 conserved hypothetical protein, possible phosphate transport regulator [Heliomicrobium modesticaldum Ice1]
MLLSLKPREDKFFTLLEQSARIVHRGSTVFQSLMKDYQLLSVKMAEITEVEHEGDDITANISDQLNATFITPIDREDIYTLSNRLDDILDNIHGTIERMHLYQTGEPSEDLVVLVNVLAESTCLLVTAFELMRHIRKEKEKIIETCARIKQCESDGDRIYRRGMAKLFDEINEPIELIKWKEIWERVEDAIDNCEHVAKIVKGVALKNA